MNKRSGMFSFLESRKGQGLSVNAIILIILGLVVLVLLILGFTLGWSTIFPFLNTNNVDTISTSCGIACSSGSQFDYCSNPRELKATGADLKKVTCNYLANNQPKYGIKTCDTIQCSSVVILPSVTTGTLTQQQCSGYAGKTIQAFIGDTLQSIDCPLPTA